MKYNNNTNKTNKKDVIFIKKNKLKIKNGGKRLTPLTTEIKKKYEFNFFYIEVKRKKS